MNKPNFFIVGAPKSGTTSLFIYLSTHPSVFMPRIKEPHFFADDMAPAREVHNLRDYLLLFKDSTETHSAIGEASTGYLYSSVALGNIRQFDPEAKIIVMLRNPVDMVYSLHSQFYYTFIENEKDFGKAWRLQGARRMGFCIPRTCVVPQVLQYRKMAQYDEQIKKLFSIFPRDGIRIIIFDDFRKSPETLYQAVLEFLDLQQDGRKDFPITNENKGHLSRFIAYFFLRHNRPLVPLREKIKKILKIKEVGIHKALSVKRKRPPLDPSLRQELSEVFRRDIENLSLLIDRDMSFWLDRPPMSSPISSCNALVSAFDPMRKAHPAGLLT